MLTAGLRCRNRLGQVFLSKTLVLLLLQEVGVCHFPKAIVNTVMYPSLVSSNRCSLTFVSQVQAAFTSGQTRQSELVVTRTETIMTLSLPIPLSQETTLSCIPSLLTKKVAIHHLCSCETGSLPMELCLTKSALGRSQTSLREDYSRMEMSSPSILTSLSSSFSSRRELRFCVSLHASERSSRYYCYLGVRRKETCHDLT